MNLIYGILEELGYHAKEIFIISYTVGDKEGKIKVAPFVSGEYDSQVYLEVSCDNNQLSDFINTNLIKEIALHFRKEAFHKAEMDRNTTLLVQSYCYPDEVIDITSKVKIEDDPYYFKKYVFSYNELSEKRAKEWLENNREKSTLVEVVQKYIMDTTNFDAYKKNYKNDPIYSYFVELVTKIPGFPMRVVDSKGITSIETYLDNNILALTKKNSPVAIDKIILEKYMGLDIKGLTFEELLVHWDEINSEGDAL